MVIDTLQYIKAMRLFKEDPKWTPLNRKPELDENTHRKKYLTTRKASAISAH
jgi:1,2-dihydroxy-3-keto-5-methylthiopentene dioxygenase